MREKFPQAGLGLEPRARCAGFSAMEIGNHKKRLRFYMSFPDRQPNVHPFVQFLYLLVYSLLRNIQILFFRRMQIGVQRQTVLSRFTAFLNKGKTNVSEKVLRAEIAMLDMDDDVFFAHVKENFLERRLNAFVKRKAFLCRESRFFYR